MVSILGIDTASFQGTVDWPKVAGAGVAFAYVKSGEGTNPNYATTAPQYNGAIAAGIPAGLYHFARPLPSYSPETNAEVFAARVLQFNAHIPGRLPPCVDIEVGVPDANDWLQRFIRTFRGIVGYVPMMIYTGASYMRDNINEGWMDPSISLWIAGYSDSPGLPAYRTPRVALHQFSDHMTLPGIRGFVDGSVPLKPLSDILIQPRKPARKDVDVSSYVPIPLDAVNSFKVTVPVEAGKSSQAIARQFIAMGTAWANAYFETSFIDDTGAVMPPGIVKKVIEFNHRQWFEVPSGAVLCVINGNVDKGGVPGASLVSIPV